MSVFISDNYIKHMFNFFYQNPHYLIYSAFTETGATQTMKTTTGRKTRAL